jgi:hypothetical protein
MGDETVNLVEPKPGLIERLTQHRHRVLDPDLLKRPASLYIAAPRRTLARNARHRRLCSAKIVKEMYSPLTTMPRRIRGAVRAALQRHPMLAAVYRHPALLRISS